MKNKLIIIATMLFSIILSLSFSSCDFLNVEDTLEQTETLDSLFAKKEGVEKLLANVYSYQLDNWEGLTYEVPWVASSDELQISYKAEYGKLIYAGNYSGDSFAGVFGINRWKYSYEGIRAANVFIQNVENCKDPKITREKLIEYKNEALFLRAYNYFLLLRQYGPFVILPEDPIDIETPSANLPSIRSTYDECVEYLVKQFDACANVLPEVYLSPNDFGRPTKGVAMAYKSRMLTYAASPLFNGNKDYSGFVRKTDGVHLINQTVNNEKWLDAINASKAVIDLAETGVYELYIVPADSKTPALPFVNSEGDYPNGPGGIDPFRSYKELFTGAPGKDWVSKEIIWARAKTNVGSNVQHQSPIGMGKNDWAGHGAGLGLVNAYFMSDGRTTVQAHQDGDYKETLETSTNVGYYTQPGTNIRYLNREPRFYVSISYQNSRVKNYSGASSPWYYINYMGADAQNSDNYTPGGHQMRKFMDGELECRHDGCRHRGAIDIRLAEIYLNYVEALNEYHSSGHPDIKKYLNLIRYRSGIKGYTDTDLNSQVKRRELIHHERRIELAFEHHRFFDSRRWKEAELGTLDHWGNSNGQGGAHYGYDMKAKTPETFFKRTLLSNRFFTLRSYLWPLPSKELTINKKLDQNPGW